MHKQAINHKQAIIGGGYLFTENACLSASHAFSIATCNIFSCNYGKRLKKKTVFERCVRFNGIVAYCVLALCVLRTA